MKEIDFLPEWYKSGKRREVNYRFQYIVLGGIFAIMMAWNLVATHSISRASAQISRQKPIQVEAEKASHKFAEIKSQVTKLQKKAESMGRIDSKIDVASVLAEMSFLIDEKVVLSKVEFGAEKFAGGQRGGAGRGSTVRFARGSSAGKNALWLGDVRFKVVINGVAAEAGDVAELVCKLEDSPYFSQVIPSFSRNAEVKAAKSFEEGKFQVSEFEISCYLANYDGFVMGN
jgi:hypothetical protein